MVDPDGHLIEQVRAGSHGAFRALVERWTRSVYRTAYRITANKEDAEDAVQETFLRVYRQLHTYDRRSAFSTWLYRISVNCSLDIVRRPSRRASADPGDPATEAPSPHRLAQDSEFRRRLGAAMDELSEQERTAFVLRHHEGLPIEEIASVLGLSESAAKHSVFRAVQKLRRQLEPLCISVKSS